MEPRLVDSLMESQQPQQQQESHRIISTPTHPSQTGALSMTANTETLSIATPAVTNVPIGNSLTPLMELDGTDLAMQEAQPADSKSTQRFPNNYLQAAGTSNVNNASGQIGETESSSLSTSDQQHPGSVADVAQSKSILVKPTPSEPTNETVSDEDGPKLSKKQRAKIAKKNIKLDAKSKLEKSRQSARECRARKKLRYQYLEDLVCNREKAVVKLREELLMFCELSKRLDTGLLTDKDRQLLTEQAKENNATP